MELQIQSHQWRRRLPDWPAAVGSGLVAGAALTVIVVGSVLFQLLSPWWTTPIASNWHQMDHTLTITVVICGLFFIAINLFVVYTVWKFRHREGQRAAYEPDNPKLERWLLIGTSVG